MKRRENESFGAYKRRREVLDVETARRLRGTLIWDSWNWGTYKRGMQPPIKEDITNDKNDQKGVIVGPDGKPISSRGL